MRGKLLTCCVGVGRQVLAKIYLKRVIKKYQSRKEQR